MVEPDLSELEGLGVAAQQLVPVQRSPRATRRSASAFEGVGDDHRRLAADRRGHVGDLGSAVDQTIAEAIAVDREQHLRFDLPESIDDRPWTEFRRARRPHRADARSREKCDHRLGDVRQVGGDPVPRSHPEPAQPATGGGYGGNELSPAQVRGRPRLGFGR